MNRPYELGQKIYFLNFKNHIVGVGEIAEITYEKDKIILNLERIDKSINIEFNSIININNYDNYTINNKECYITDSILEFQASFIDYYDNIFKKIKMLIIKKLKPSFFIKEKKRENVFQLGEVIYFHLLNYEYNKFVVGKGTIKSLSFSKSIKDNFIITFDKHTIGNNETYFNFYKPFKENVEKDFYLISNKDAIFSTHQELEQHFNNFIEVYKNKLILLFKENFNAFENLSIEN